MPGAARLLERDRELAVIESLTAATGSQGALAVIEGPAGIGKTAVLARAEATAAACGLSVLRARGIELERDFAFGVARQLLEPALRSAGPRRRAGLLAEAGSFASRLLDADIEAPAAIVTDASFAALRALHLLLAGLARQRPLLLAIDDLQWADAASLRWLAYLAPRLAELPVLVVMAVRSEELAAAPELSALLSGAEVTRLAPLSSAAVSSLLCTQLGLDQVEDGFVAACHQATGGNPLYLRELISELLAQGMPADAEGARRVEAIGPAGIARVVLARLARLSPAAISVAGVSAVLQADAEPATVSQLTGVPVAEVRAAADALTATGILENRLPLTFVHPILRTAVYTDLGPGRRAELHARAAAALADRGAPADAVAAHVLACDARGEASAVAWLRRAASDALARGAPENAVTYLQRALREPPATALERAQVLAELGAAEACGGARADTDGAIAHLSEALAGGLGPSQQARIARVLGGVLLATDRGEEAARVLAATIEELGEAPDELAVPLVADLAVIGMSSPAAHRAGLPYFARFAGPPAEAVSGQAKRLAAGMAAGAAVMFGGDAAAAGSLARAALQDGRLLGEETADSLAFYLPPIALLWSEHAGEARAALAAAVSEAESRGSSRGLSMALSLRGAAELRLGALADAHRDASSALALTREIGLRLGAQVATSTLVEVLVSQGELERAAAAGQDESLQATDSVWGAWMSYALGRLALEQGRSEPAAERAARAGAHLEGWHISTWPGLPWRSLRAVALAGLGGAEHAAQARRLVAAELADARRFGAGRLIGLALLRCAQVEARLGGDLRHVVSPLLVEAVGVLAGSTARLEHARALVELGMAERRLGSVGAARESLRAGLASARACGAQALAAQAHNELEASGLRPRKVLTSGVDALTPSERRVAEMAARGMTNREIAQALVLTTRTVETHLAHTYQKLDIRSRRELAGRLE
jgi:DNA-binding CsgD family transcriptional regulator/tetratricopeptide (TPR) repeat protein